MLKFLLFGFLFTFISASSYSSDNIPGKICGTYPRTFRCPENTKCGTYTDRLCLKESNGSPIGGIIVFSVIGVLIFIMILKACIVCCSPRNSYQSISSNDSAYLARSGAVVCTVATSHF